MAQLRRAQCQGRPRRPPRLQGLAVGERVGLYLAAAPIWWPACWPACGPVSPSCPSTDFPGGAAAGDRLPGAPVGGDLRRRGGRPPDPAVRCAPWDGPAAGPSLWPQVDDALAAYMMLTSGSTGEPRGWSSVGGPCSASLDGIRERLGLTWLPLAIHHLTWPRHLLAGDVGAALGAVAG